MVSFNELTGTQETRYWLFFFIIAAVSIFLVISLNKMGACPSYYVYNSLEKRMQSIKNPNPSPEIIEIQHNQIGLNTILEKDGNKTRFKYEYRLWPERSFQDPDNYAFYSMYGWRMNPPVDYPQPTINTVYDEAIRNCNCSPAGGNEACLSKCRFQALIAAGFPSMFSK